MDNRPFHSAPPASPSLPLDLGFLGIFRSWFWRYYDHLFRLLLYNIGWALSCFGVAWAAVHFGWADLSKAVNLPRLIRLYWLYLAECAVSVGWAYMVFTVFIAGDGKAGDYWRGMRLYFWKALGVSALSGFLIGLAGYNFFFYLFLGKSHHRLGLLLVALVLWLLVFWLSTCLYQWPLLFFQNPPFFKIFYKSMLIALGNGLVSLGILAFFAACFVLFLVATIPSWFFIGAVFFFSFQCVALEKNLLRYKITYDNRPLEFFAEQLDREKKRGWKDFFRPWENR